MGRTLDLCAGLGIGAGLMYLLDPQVGRRRRALLRDQFIHASRQFDHYVEATWNDVCHRAEGLSAQRIALSADGPEDDRVIADRVRSKLGRYCSHPHALDVTVRGGQVTLSGPVLEHEVSDLLAATATVRGVKGVDNRLQPHAQAENIPALQGGRARPGERLNITEANWAPATRLMAGLGGAALLGFGSTRRFPEACILGTIGLGLMARAFTNLEMTRLLGVGAGRRAVEVRKTVTFNGSPEHVFPFFAHYDTFPRIMSHIREVRDLGGGRSHWVADGPGGIPVAWDAEITRFEPNRFLAWRSEDGSVLPNAGVIRFDPTPEGGTRVDIRLAYTPPGGALAHFAARLFGADARSLMDEDLNRLKGLIEEGRTRTPQGGEVSRQEVVAGLA